LRDTLDRLISLARGDNRELTPKDNIEPLVKLSEIIDRLRRLLIRFMRDFASVSPIHIFFILREKL